MNPSSVILRRPVLSGLVTAAALVALVLLPFEALVVVAVGEVAVVTPLLVNTWRAQ